MATPSAEHLQPTSVDDLPDATDMRLVVVDMDGTLLDGAGDLPAGIWELVERLTARGISFVPASGRQYATLAAMFHPIAAHTPFIAENGTVVIRNGQTLSSLTMAREIVTQIVATVRREVVAGADAGVVLCGQDVAYIERSDAPFYAECQKYYHSLHIVDDVLAMTDEIIKIAVFSFENAEQSIYPALRRYRDEVQVVVSGQHWIDLMAHGANKGAAVRALQAEMGVTAAQTVAFGDYLNDVELIDAADLSFAMANAHPIVADHANFVAPANTENGVVVTLERLLAQ